MDEEVFTVADVTLQFADTSEIVFRDGQLHATLDATGAPDRPDLFSREFHDTPSVRITRLCFPTPEGRVVHAFNETYSRYRPHMWFDGFPTATEFAGDVRVADGWLVLDGELRLDYGKRPGPRILIRKRFVPGEIDPGAFTHESLTTALAIDVRFVQRADLWGSGPVPPELFRLTELRELELSGFTADDPLHGFAQLQRLRRLKLNQMTMASLPEGVVQLPSLESLEIRETQLAALPDSIANLTRLESLTINSTPLQTLPEAVFQLPKLSYADLQYNKLRALPELAPAKQLAQLQLKGNPFKSLPRWLASVKKVGLEAKFKPLYMDAAYPRSPAAQPASFTAAGDKAFVKRLDALLREHDLKAHRKALLRLSRRGVQFATTTRDDHAKTGNTRFGGDPDLPQAMPYPPTTAMYAWIFIAQIDLESIATLQDFLPRTGMLSFFVSDLEHVEAVKVMHHPKGTPLRRCPPPADALFDQGPFDGFEAQASLAYSLPYAAHQEALRALQEDDAAAERYDKVLDALMPARGPGENDRHAINTHVFTQNETSEEQAAEKSGGQAEEWRVLLTLGWDANTGFCFWDAGTLSFMIHERDLANADFSNVVACIYSS